MTGSLPLSSILGTYFFLPRMWHMHFFFADCGYQALFPRSYRLDITIILQDYPGFSRTLWGVPSLFTLENAVTHIYYPPRCVSTTYISSQRDQPPTAVPSHMINIKYYTIHPGEEGNNVPSIISLQVSSFCFCRPSKGVCET